MQITVAVLDRIGEDGELARNLAALRDAVAGAAEAGASLLLTGECFLTGYDHRTAEQARQAALPATSSAWPEVAEIAAVHGVHVAVGALTSHGPVLRNSLRLQSPDGGVAHYDKTHVPALGADRWVEPGATGFDRPVRTPFGEVGLMICYDVRFPEAARTLALHGARILLVPACYPVGAERVPAHFPTVRAMENGVVVLMAAGAGTGRGGTRFVSGSQIVGPLGEQLATRVPGTDLLHARIDVALAGRDAGPAAYPGYALDLFRDRRPEYYSLRGAP